MAYYPIADRLTGDDAKSLGIKLNDVTVHSRKVCSLSHDGDVNVMAKKKIHPDHLFDSDMNAPVCVLRPPKQGEWFLSGAVPAAYKATFDMSVSYHILELVLVKKVTITTEVEVTL